LKEDELNGATNGWHRGHGAQRFACGERRAVFVPFTHVKLDERFGDTAAGRAKNGQQEHLQEQDFGAPDCPPVVGAKPPMTSSDLAAATGRNRGVQGHQNSCYLDAMLFAMFSFSRLEILNPSFCVFFLRLVRFKKNN